MITKVNSSKDMCDALNENLNGILTKERSIGMAKEVNNTLGKLLYNVKLEIMHNSLLGVTEKMDWFKKD